MNLSVSKTIAELAEDLIWIYEHWEELCKSHPEKVVGVDHGSIVGSADSFGHLHQILREKGLRPAEVATALINTHPEFVAAFIARRGEKIEGLRNGDISP